MFLYLIRRHKYPNNHGAYASQAQQNIIGCCGYDELAGAHASYGGDDGGDGLCVDKIYSFSSIVLDPLVLLQQETLMLILPCMMILMEQS